MERPKYRRSKKNTLRKYKKIYEILISVVFILFVGEMSIINLVKKDDLISVQENRSLQQKPEFSAENLISGDFTKEYSTYMSDQFPMRNTWIKLKTNLDLKLGKNEINNVFIGKDNYLLEDFKEESVDETKEKTDVINEFAKKYKDLNISFMLVPTATKIWEDKLPKYAPVDDELKYISQVKDNLNENVEFINVYDTLYENKDDYIYYKTDHHWTSKGAYIAYKKMCKQLDLKAKEESDFNINEVTNSFYGSLYSKLGAGIGEPDSIDVYLPKKDGDVVVNYVNEGEKIASLYNTKSLEEQDKYQVFTGGNHPLINIKSLADPKKKLLVIKDSYANSFLPFLTAHYGEIDVVDLRYYTDNIDDLIKTDDITDILFLYNAATFNEDKSILNIVD